MLDRNSHLIVIDDEGHDIVKVTVPDGVNEEGLDSLDELIPRDMIVEPHTPTAVKSEDSVDRLLAVAQTAVHGKVVGVD